MSRSQDLQKNLDSLYALRDDPGSEATLATLRAALCERRSAVAATAAKLVAELELDTLAPELVEAFGRFMQNPAKSDRGCLAKTAIASALYRLGCREPEVFLAGIHHVQREPRADSAVGLRGVCALGLVRIGHPDTLDELAELLADPETPARIAAVRALAYREDESGAPLLRLKARSGDPQIEVVSEALVALLQIARARALAFVCGFLDESDPRLAESAALALGGSKLPGAFDALQRFWDRTRDPELRETALTAIATLRDDRALEFLFNLLAGAPGPTAREALIALGLYRDDEAVATRARQIARSREDIDLTRELATEFGTGH